MVLIGMGVFIPLLKSVLKSLPRSSIFLELGTALIKYRRRTRQLQRCDLELASLLPVPDFR